MCNREMVILRNCAGGNFFFILPIRRIPFVWCAQFKITKTSCFLHEILSQACGARGVQRRSVNFPHTKHETSIQDAWELAHVEMTMRMCDLMRSSCPVSTSLTLPVRMMMIAFLASSLTPLSLILSSTMLDFNTLLASTLTVYLFTYSLPSSVPQTYSKTKLVMIAITIV